MDYVVTVNLLHAFWIVFYALVVYIYIKDDGDDHLTQKRHNVEMRKEWFRMLAEQNKARQNRLNIRRS
jgi:hypothetical protein